MTILDRAVDTDSAPDHDPVSADPVAELATWMLDNVRPEDTPAIKRVVADLMSRIDGPPAKATDVLHSSVVASATFDGANHRELGYLKAPSMSPDLSGLFTVDLPPPAPVEMSLVDAIEERRSDHNYEPGGLALDTLSTLLHHSAGVRETRTAYNVRSFPVRRNPSAGGLQPVDIYIAANDVHDLERGLYQYGPSGHQLGRVDTGNMRGKITDCTIFSQWLFAAPAVAILVIDLDRVSWKYGTRGYRFAHVDLGVLTQNLYLMGTALDLTTCAVAAFDDDAVNDFLRIDGRTRFASLLFGIGRAPGSCAT